jgi:hypothetical protein
MFLQPRRKSAVAQCWKSNELGPDRVPYNFLPASSAAEVADSATHVDSTRKMLEKETMVAARTGDAPSRSDK